MSVRRLADVQPETFAFTEENVAWAHEQIAKYPEGRQASAVISLLWKVQEQEGWVSEPAIELVSSMLSMAKIRVLEIATFYTMFNLAPVGKIAHVQVCGTTPCWLRGAEDLKAICRKRISTAMHTVSEDGNFSWEEVECLGACVNAPMIQIASDYYEDLDAERFEGLLDKLAAGEAIKPGPQIDRQFSAPVGGPTTLTSDPTRAPVAALATTEASPEPAPPPVVAAPPAPAETAPKAETETDTAAGETAPTDDDRPDVLTAPRGGQPDDLTRISGIGPKIADILNDLGVYHFDQIAAWGPRQVAWVDERLRFKGRIEREEWIPQAKAIVDGAGE